MGTLAPEVKRLTLSQRLNGKNGHQNTSLTGFLLFFVTCHAARDVTQCHAMSRNIYIFNPGGLPYESGGDARRKFWMKPLKKTNLGVGQPFFTPKRYHFVPMFFRYWCLYRKLWLHELSKNQYNCIKVSLIALIFGFFPSLLSSELVLFFTEVKVKAFFLEETFKKIAGMSKVR